MHRPTNRVCFRKNVQFLLKFLILTNDIDFFFQQEVIDLTRSGNGWPLISFLKSFAIVIS